MTLFLVRPTDQTLEAPFRDSLPYQVWFFQVSFESESSKLMYMAHLCWETRCLNLCHEIPIDCIFLLLTRESWIEKGQKVPFRTPLAISCLRPQWECAKKLAAACMSKLPFWDGKIAFHNLGSWQLGWEGRQQRWVHRQWWGGKVGVSCPILVIFHLPTT